MTLVEQRDFRGELIVAPADMTPFLADSSGIAPEGEPLAVLRAADEDDVRTLLRIAHTNRIPVSVRGAGSGLVGGATAYADGFVVDLQRMDAILEIDAASRLAVVEPGVITADLDAAAAAHGLMYAPDPASHRISTIGGNIGTNAGGLRCVAYGVTADSVAALRVVLADGRIVSTGSRTRKHVAGYDLTRLFTGSEGTLGVITQATVRLASRPRNVQSFLAAFRTPQEAGAAIAAIMRSDVTPLTLEFIDAATAAAISAYTGTATRSDHHLVMGQVFGWDVPGQLAQLRTVAAVAGAEEFLVGAAEELLEARRQAGPALSARALQASCDVAVPLGRLVDMFAAIERVGAAHGRNVTAVAHAGDGNLHPSVELLEDSPDEHHLVARILEDVIDAALALGGTVTGEHGIGQKRRDALARQYDRDSLDVHRTIKQALDPRLILSPGRSI